MKKLIVCLIGLVAVVGLVILWLAEGPMRSRPPTDAELYRARVKVGQAAPATPSQAALVTLPVSRNVRLAVGGLGFRDDEENRQLGDLITVKLTGTPGFEMVERQSLAVILQELNLNWSGLVRARDVVRAGKLLKVDWFLVGTEATINGTNTIVARVVDARTGVMRDAGVFPTDKPSLQLADDLAGFMRQSRKDAATAKMRTYLAIGAFEDLSVNNRQANFPAQIRGYLTAAYRGSGVTLLEREYVETLLQEVHLDLAGLTEEGDQNPPPPMQSAFWLVSGQYQSYETTNLQVEVNLDVDRIFGRSWHQTLRGLPGEPAGRLVKAVIDQTMSQNSGAIMPTRLSEARLQMYMGKDMSGFDKLGLPGGDTGLVWVTGNWDVDPQLAAKQKRKIEEAVRAFGTVLLLEPTNREARMYLAACWRIPVMSRTDQSSYNSRGMDEARNYYREIIEAPVQDKWTGLAEQALPMTFYSSADERLRWFQSAAAQTTNTIAAAFYGKQAEAAETDIIVENGNSPQAAEIAEQRLFESIKSFKNAIEGKSGTYRDDMGMNDYIGVFSWDRTTAAQKLVELLPKMKQQVPELEPYLLATVLAYQADTNTPLAAKFQQTLTNFVEHPQQVLAPAYFWDKIRWSVYEWCIEKTNYSLAINLIEGERQAAAGGKVASLDFDDQEKIKLAYLYLAVQRWQEALDIFETFHNKPFQATQTGPWGEAFQPILTDNLSDFCRKQLGLAVTQDPRKFDLGKPIMCLCSPSTFVADDNGLWVGMDGQLLHLDFDLKTNLAVNLPMDNSIPITALCLTESKIWIGTQGAGLIEFDKASRQCRRLTQADGLMMDNLASLEVAGDSLWIGYSGATGGGLGRLDLRSQKLTSFMPSLFTDSSPRVGAGPPRDGIGGIVAGVDGDLWVSVDCVIRQFHVAHGTWETLTNRSGEWVTCLSADPGHLAEGGGTQMTEIEIETKPGPTTNQTVKTKRVISTPDMWKLEADFKTNGNHQQIISYASAQIGPKGGVAFQNLRDHHWQYLEDPNAIPNPPSTMTLAGNDLWVGGEGAIALVDLTAGKVRKFCHIKATGVDRIQIGGGYVWAQFNWHLYRVPLGNLD